MTGIWQDTEEVMVTLSGGPSGAVLSGASALWLALRAQEVHCGSERSLGVEKTQVVLQ